MLHNLMRTECIITWLRDGKSNYREAIYFTGKSYNISQMQWGASDGRVSSRIYVIVNIEIEGAHFFI